MAVGGWTFDELLTNGWYPHWHPRASDDDPHALTFTYYRSEISQYSLEASGKTEEAAQADAAARANEWLDDHSHFKPRRPPRSR